MCNDPLVRPSAAEPCTDQFRCHLARFHEPRVQRRPHEDLAAMPAPKSRTVMTMSPISLYPSMTTGDPGAWRPALASNIGRRASPTRGARAPSILGGTKQATSRPATPAQVMLDSSASRTSKSTRPLTSGALIVAQVDEHVVDKAWRSFRVVRFRVQVRSVEGHDSRPRCRAVRFGHD